MRKVLSFSAFLVVGLFIAQYLPAWSGSDYGTVKTVSNVLLYICLGFIMINVGREFEVDKKELSLKWKGSSNQRVIHALVSDCYLLYFCFTSAGILE